MGKNIKVTLSDTVVVTDKVTATIGVAKASYRFWKDHKFIGWVNFSLAIIVTVTISFVFKNPWLSSTVGVVWILGTWFFPMAHPPTLKKYTS